MVETAERAAALGVRPLVAHCRLRTGELCAGQGHRSRAWASGGDRSAQALGMPLYAACAERGIGVDV